MSRYTSPKIDIKGTIVEVTTAIPQEGPGDPGHLGNPAFRVSAVGSVGFNL